MYAFYNIILYSIVLIVCGGKDCIANETCSGNGSCSYLGECECSGNFDGPACNVCKPTFYGDECDHCNSFFLFFFFLSSPTLVSF